MQGETWALYFPQQTEGTPHHVSIQLGHSYLLLGVKGRNLNLSFSLLLICSGSHVSSYFPHCSSQMPPALHVAEVSVLLWEGGGACHKDGCPKSDYLHDLCDK